MFNVLKLSREIYLIKIAMLDNNDGNHLDSHISFSLVKLGNKLLFCEHDLLNTGESGNDLIHGHDIHIFSRMSCVELLNLQYIIKNFIYVVIRVIYFAIYFVINVITRP